MQPYAADALRAMRGTLSQTTSRRGDTKGAYLSTRHTPAPIVKTTTKAAVGQPNWYAVLGVDPDCEPEEIKLAYRQKSLTEHPDKGGDQDRFDAIFYAFNLLKDPERRLEYDEELARIASEAVLVEGKPEVRSTGEGVAREKTAPAAGSKRQKDWHNRSQEWEGEKQGSFVLQNIKLALTDAARETPAIIKQDGTMAQKSPDEIQKEQTEALFKKFKELPKGSKGQQAWMNSLDAKQKAALKNLAKKEEAAAKEKAQKWLKGGKA